MTFQGYMDNIEAKTGRKISEILEAGERKGLLEAGKAKEGVKAGQIVEWLGAEYELGRGHAMAIWAIVRNS